MRPVTRHMTNRQRAEISASKRFNKNKQIDEWNEWVIYYEGFLVAQALPAQAI